MPQSLARVLIHLIFSTKHRAPMIAREHSARLFAYLGSALNGVGCPVLVVGGVRPRPSALRAWSKHGVEQGG